MPADLPLSLDWLPWAGAVPPAFIFLGSAVLVMFCRRESRRPLQRLLLLVTPLVGALNILALDQGSSWAWHFLDLELELLRVDRLSWIFGILFHLGAFIGAVYAFRVRDSVQHVAALAYAGSALGAVFAGDLVSLFFYWEGMALSSAFLVWARRTPDSNAAGIRYLLLHLTSGLLLLAGAAIIYQETGGVSFDHIGTGSLAGWLILLAFGIKCGFPLLHAWITDAYPQSTPSGTVFLSMFTTKVAVYALARGYAGTELLVVVGTVMALFPIFYAVIENDLRRVLGYSMINQIGFMVVGVGIGTELALNGAVAHAFNEVLFKGLLFMSMGAVLFRARHVLGSDLGGLYRSMPLTTLLCVVGAASISAFPLFNGFVSKSMIMAAMVEQGHILAWFGLLFASAGVFHHAGIKIPYFAFFARDSGLRVREAPSNMLLAMAIAAGLCLLIGVYPSALHALLPWQLEYMPYTYPHVMVQVQLLLFSALAFAWLKLAGVYPPELRSVNLDVDWLYRGLGAHLSKWSLDSLDAAMHKLANQVRTSIETWLRAIIGFDDRFTRTAGTGAAVLVVGIVLASSLLLYYIAA